MELKVEGWKVGGEFFVVVGFLEPLKEWGCTFRVLKFEEFCDEGNVYVDDVFGGEGNFVHFEGDVGWVLIDWG